MRRVSTLISATLRQNLHRACAFRNGPMSRSPSCCRKGLAAPQSAHSSTGRRTSCFFALSLAGGFFVVFFLTIAAHLRFGFVKSLPTRFRLTSAFFPSRFRLASGAVPVRAVSAVSLPLNHCAIPTLLVLVSRFGLRLADGIPDGESPAAAAAT